MPQQPRTPTVNWALFERQRYPGTELLLLPPAACQSQPEVLGRIGQKRPDPLALSETESLLIDTQGVQIEGVTAGLCSLHAVALLCDRSR